MIEPEDGSALALRTFTVASGVVAEIGDAEHDWLLYVAAGEGLLAIGDRSAPVRARSAGLVLAGETAALHATEQLEVVAATVGPEVDLHAPLGPRELVTSLDADSARPATGSRSFQILFDASSGSTRATLFAGYIPPGKAPWHYHLYDEIVWVPEGPGRLHLGDSVDQLAPGSAFRLRPRQVHIVENTSADRDLTVIGVFTPAGTPSAAYLTPEVAAEYRFAG